MTPAQVRALIALPYELNLEVQLPGWRDTTLCTVTFDKDTDCIERVRYVDDCGDEIEVDVTTLDHAAIYEAQDEWEKWQRRFEQ